MPITARVAALSLIFAAALALTLEAQSQEPVTFAVATVRPTEITMLDLVLKNIPDIALTGTHVELNSASLNDLMRFAYDVPGFLIKVPERLQAKRYHISAIASRDITTKAETSRVLTHKELGEPLKTLLTERFLLKMHVEQQKMPVYLLMVAPNGLKMTPAPESRPLKATNRPDGMRQMDYVTTLDGFTAMPQNGRPVVDRTGLQGVYSGTLTVPIAEIQAYASAGMRGDGPQNPMFSAIEQLGLRYVPATELMDVYIVDSADDNPSVD